MKMKRREEKQKQKLRKEFEEEERQRRKNDIKELKKIMNIKKIMPLATYPYVFI